MGGADLPQKRGEKMGVWICKKSDLILHFESSLKIFYWGIPLFAAPMKYCSCFLSDSGRRAIPRKEANNHCFPYKKKKPNRIRWPSIFKNSALLHVLTIRRNWEIAAVINCADFVLFQRPGASFAWKELAKYAQKEKVSNIVSQKKPDFP